MKKSYDTSTIIGRAIIAFKCKTMVELANIFDLFPQDLSNRLRRNSFIDLIEDEAKKRNINLNWIKTGQGEMTETPSNHISNQSPEDLLRKAAKVLRSNSSFCRALDSNIESFHEAIKLREDLDVARAELKQYQITLEEQNKLIEQQQHEIENMKSIIAAGSQTISQQHNDIETLKAQVDSLNATIFAIKSA